MGAVAFLFLAASWSLGSALAAPGTLPLSIRFVEWVRGHGGGPFVIAAEKVWYSINKPPVGGKPSRSLLTLKGSRPVKPLPAKPAVPQLPPPASIPQLPGVSVAGEGTWRAIGTPVDGVPAMYATQVAPDALHTSLVTGVVWMDQKLLSARLFAGSQSPGVGTWQFTSPIQGSTATGLEALFNAGFRMNASQGGWYSEGKVGVPLVNGAASFVIFNNGTASVGTWGRNYTMSPNIASVRQNLSLIVNHGQPVPGLSNNNFQQWGATLGNQLMVWRSGVGVTANGALVYAGGPGMSITSLASVLVRAGAVRAMEMDINTDWVNFFYFEPAAGQAASPSNGAALLSDMVRPVTRYFGPTARDFIGIYARPVPGAAASG